MKVGIIIFNGFVHFEVAIVSYLLNTKFKVVTLAPTVEGVRSEEGMIIQPDEVISEKLVESLNCLIIPGGNEENIINNQALKSLVSTMNKNKKILGAICSGVLVFAEMGVLKEQEFTTSIPQEEFSKHITSTYKDQNTVSSGHVVTAKANGYVDFALELGKKLKLFEDYNDFEETRQFFKEFKSL